MIGRLLVLAAFLAGAAGFFLPFLTVTAKVGVDDTAQLQTVSLSAMQIMQGVSAIEEVASGAAGAAGAGGMTDAQRAELDGAVNQIRGALLIPFAPTALFLLILLFSIKRFGRAAGVLSLIVGILGLAGWFLLNAAAAEAERAGGGFAIGFTLLVVGAGLGTLGGIAGIAKPQQPAAA